MLTTSAPAGVTDPKQPARWRCDYKNTSTETELIVKSDVYCLRHE